jgi:hypothetical protein
MVEAVGVTLMVGADPDDPTVAVVVCGVPHGSPRSVTVHV